MTYIGNTSPSRFSSVPAVQRFSGNNSTTAFTLSTAIGSEQEILVSVDGVIQDTANYTVSGTTLTFSPAPSAGTNNIFVFTLSRAIASVTHPPTSALSATSGTFSGNVSVGGDLDVTGSLDMSDANLTNVGSISLDSISGDADTNTNITFSGSDVITFTTGGSTAFTANANQSVTFSGNIIGTLATAAQTNITSVGTLTSFRSTGIDDNADALVITIDSGENVAIGVTSKNSSNNGSLTIGHSGMTKITASANGNADELVLIGANASANVGMSIIANNANISGIFLGDEDDTDIGRIEYYHSDNSMRFQTNTAERMRINSSGLVGIGTTAPTSPLHVVSGEIGNGSNKGIKIANHNASKAYSIRTGITGSENTSLSIHDDTAGVSRITIDTSGRVGIGASNMGSYQANNDDLLIATSGSTGITIRSGSADQGRIAFADGTGDLTEEMRGLLMYNHNGNAMSLFTNSAERMRITDNGSVVIGATATDAKLEVKHSVNATSTIIAGAQLMTANNYHDLVLGHGADYAVGIRRLLQQGTPAYLRPRMDFFVQNYNTYLPTDRVVRMTILDTGNVGIGTTTPSAKFEVAGNDPNPLLKFNQFQNADEVLLMMRHDYARTNGQTATMIQFQNNSNVEKGTIKTSLNATQFNTSSDYRLKENVNYTWDATTRLKQLKPARFNWISDDTNTLVDGFLAHEVQSVVPQAVDGNKDDMLVETKYTKDDVETQGDNPSKSVGDPKTYSSTEINPQGIDQSKLIPLLTKALQEQQATIEALTARIVSLESKE